MGIDLYAFSEEYVKLVAANPDEPYETWVTRRKAYPELGYVRESYHGVTHAVRAFCPETYGESPLPPGAEALVDEGYFYIPSAILESRMPEVEKLCRQRAQDYFVESNKPNNGYSHGDTEEERDAYAASQIAAFRKIVNAVKDAESHGLKVYLLNSY